MNAKFDYRAGAHMCGSFETEARRLDLRSRHTPESQRDNGNPVGAYILPVRKGFGWSSGLQKIESMVKEAGLFRFDGVESVIETSLDARLDDPVARIRTAINVCRRFNAFRGIVGIRMDGWEDNLNSYAVNELLEMAADNRDNIIFVFGLNGENPEAVDKLLTRLSPCFSVRCLEAERLTSVKLADNISRCLGQSGLTVDKNGREELLKVCEHAVESESFLGFRTASVIVDDLIGTALEKGARKRVSAELIAEYRCSDLFYYRCSGTDHQHSTGFRAE